MTLDADLTAPLAGRVFWTGDWAGHVRLSAARAGAEGCGVGGGTPAPAPTRTRACPHRHCVQRDQGYTHGAVKNGRAAAKRLLSTL